MHSEAVAWTTEGAVAVLDQTLLPEEVHFVTIEQLDDLVEAIQSLRVRGAPLLGVAGAMGLAACARRALRNGEFTGGTDVVREWLEQSAETLKTSRPTAVNLGWAVDRVVREAIAALDNASNAAAGDSVVETLRESAQRVWDDDAERCVAMGRQGITVVPDQARFLTICNTGMLATGGIGTAFGVIRTAHEAGKLARVYACETRPLCQGARLTTWELARLGIPATVLVDSAAATLLSQGSVDLIVTGADRIAANGDTANKIGTLTLANLARQYSVPFYVVAPLSTVDPECPDGTAIPIEQRAASEVARIAPGVDVYNPAFDVTPADMISGIVTEGGVLLPPFVESIRRVLGG